MPIDFDGLLNRGVCNVLGDVVAITPKGDGETYTVTGVVTSERLEADIGVEAAPTTGMAFSLSFRAAEIPAGVEFERGHHVLSKGQVYTVMEPPLTDDTGWVVAVLAKGGLNV